MKKLTLTGLIILGFLVAIGAGCQKTEPTISTETPFVGGTNGLLITFSDEFPEKVSDAGQYPFNIVLKVQNDGEALVAKNALQVTLGGLYAPDFGKKSTDTNKTSSMDFEPKKKDSTGKVMEGTTDYIEFIDFNYNKTLQGNTLQTVQATACYKYYTLANVKYCVRENLVSGDEGICDVSAEKPVYNSAAPVQVISFQQNSAGSDKLHFVFKIRKAGSEDIFKHDTRCFDKGTARELNKVKVTVDTELVGLTCSGLSEPTKAGTSVSGYARLSNGEATVACNQDIADPKDFEKIAKITLGYDVRQTIQRELLIEHIG